MFISLLLLIPCLVCLVSAQLPSDCDRFYTVQQGDICDSISAQNNVSTYQLAALNYNQVDGKCDNLMPGQVLCIGTPGEDCQDTYVVTWDDTCDGVAETFGVNTTVFSANNPQVDQVCDNLYVGEVVCVASTVIAPPLPSGTLPTAIPSNSPTALPWCD